MTAQPPDFPAAHSMDTQWFAMDEDGHVAAFQSGEGGAVPSHHHSLGFDECWYVDLPLLESRAEWMARLRWFPVAVLRGAPTMTVFGIADRARAAVLALRFDMRARITEGVVPGAPEKAIVQITEPSAVALEMLRVAGISEIVIQRPDGEELDPLAVREETFSDCAFLRGLYTYGPGDPASPAPYYLETAPVEPLHVSALAEGIRHKLRSMELKGIRFAETRAIQPLELGIECVTWNDDLWRAVDGTYHTISGAPVPPYLLEWKTDPDRAEEVAAMEFYERLHWPRADG